MASEHGYFQCNIKSRANNRMTKQTLLTTPITLENALRCMLPPYGAVMQVREDRRIMRFNAVKQTFQTPLPRAINSPKPTVIWTDFPGLPSPRGMLLAEEDFWMFDPTPRLGDLLQWENAYGKKVTGIKICSSDHSHTVELGHSEDNIPNTDLSLDEYGLRIVERPHKDTGVMMPFFNPWKSTS